MDCLFCKIIENKIPSYTIYEDDIVKVILDINSNANGHSLIIPKQHFINLLDIDLDTLNHINTIIKQMYELFKNKLHADGLTIIQNNDYGQEIKHFHIHLLPRYSNDNYHANYTKDKIKNIEEIYLQLI